MTIPEMFLITSNPALSLVIWFVVLAVVMYLARSYFHSALLSFTRGLQHAFRLSSRSVMLLEQRMEARNREVLFSKGREAKERIIEREFERVDATVRKELAEYPSLHRHISEEITKIDEDYNASTEVPPTPSGWVKAVEAVAQIPATKSDPMVGRVLDDIHKSMVKAEAKATDEYRKSSRQRHSLLNKMMPHWRKLMTLLDQVDKNVNSLIARSIILDRHMEDYEGIIKKTDRALKMLSSSSLTEFFISTFVLVIAVGGAVINFHLIARPLSEMVGGTSMMMGFKINNIAAMVIILVELTMGLFLMEAMRITRLFPVISALSDRARINMARAFFVILLILASIEAGLAFMREILIEEDAATRALLRGDGVASALNGGSSYLWITTAAQMGMGFILPFALMFVAIPLESFVQSLRTVLGILAVGGLRSLSWLLRLLGNVSSFSGRTLINIYDVIIFGPLLIEKLVMYSRHKNTPSKPDHYSEVAP